MSTGLGLVTELTPRALDGRVGVWKHRASRRRRRCNSGQDGSSSRGGRRCKSSSGQEVWAMTALGRGCSSEQMEAFGSRLGAVQF